ncbi:hypothetical protein [Sandaracinus amylolyticus]|uniref:hypothetical protein n=1 Tax=Sandaracinus amylolyticus TaxID=927083 RepID=UPI001F15D605|nr:hypothetical protein [Sandaracinus amylolyticus]UJR82460.1 Hypothetical protein I5071_45250 [Sandaracinus amylolyticus]
MRARSLVAFVLLVSLAACGEDRPASSPGTQGGASATKSEPARVPRREQEEGLARCGEVLARIEGPETAPTFARLMRECGGMFARRRCRDALAAEPFSREGVAEACRADYCDELRPAPSFCTTDMPTDAEFLEQFARFSRAALRRDLRRLMDREGADEIADLFADLIETQAALQ